MLNQSLTTNTFDMPVETDMAWCPGCGNFPILRTVKEALIQANISQNTLTLVSGIGQAAKLPQYLKCHYFNGLHGRALPAATGIKAAHPALTVVVTSGDGDIYGEGGNHLIHTIRRNPDITVLVHDNMIYGLTKGQASPTSEEGLVTPTQPRGVYVDPINPLTLAISMDAPFVARTSAGEPAHMKEIIAQAIAHKGFSLVDIFQPCVVFNKVNTYQWFKEKTYIFDEHDHDVTDRNSAFARAIEDDRFGLGVFYRNDARAVFEDEVGIYGSDVTPLYARKRQTATIKALLAMKR